VRALAYLEAEKRTFYGRIVFIDKVRLDELDRQGRLSDT
jgi:hypothetical protein